MSAIQLLTALTSHLRRDLLETFLEWLRLECIQMQKFEMANRQVFMQADSYTHQPPHHPEAFSSAQ
jgi:hypothetical protein